MDFIKEFEKEVATRTENIRREKFNIETKLLVAQKEIKRLNARNVSNLNASVRDMIDEDNIHHLINKKKTFSGGDVSSQMDKPPIWFQLVVEYWNDRNEILDILEYFEIEFPKWAREMKMPHEYTKEELLHFMDTMNNHYVCNGQTHSGNLGFWFGEHRGGRAEEYWINPKKMMSHQYSEIPWQFLLKNPLLLSDKDVFSSMVKCIASGSQHAFYFMEIGSYQKIEDKDFKKMLVAILKSDRPTDYALNFVGKNIGSVQITKRDKELVEFACKRHTGSILSNSCDIIHEHYVRNNVKGLSDKIEYIERCDRFDKSTKAGLIKEFVLDKYSNKIMAKELLEA